MHSFYHWDWSVIAYARHKLSVEETFQVDETEILGPPPDDLASQGYFHPSQPPPGEARWHLQEKNDVLPKKFKEHFHMSITSGRRGRGGIVRAVY